MSYLRRNIWNILSIICWMGYITCSACLIAQGQHLVGGILATVGVAGLIARIAFILLV